MEYIIVGDTTRYNDCLVCSCGTSKSHAEAVLNRMLNDPTENDKKLIEGHANLRIETTSSEDAWWNDPVMSN